MKKRQIYELSSFLLIFILGISLIAIPTFGFEDINYLFFIVMIIYGLISYVLYMLTRQEGDYEHLFISLACVLAGTAGLTFHFENPQMVLPLALIGWISMVAIIKLIKMDYYHDRDNVLWFVRTICFVLLLIFGTITCINLYFNSKIQSIMLGFFIMVVAILESFDPIVDYLLISRRRHTAHRLEPVLVKENGVKEAIAELKKEMKPEVKEVVKEKEVITKTPSKTTTTKKPSGKTSTKTPAVKKTATKKATPKTATGKTSSSKTTATKKPATTKKATAKKTTTAKAK